MTATGLREQRRRQALEINREHLLDAAEAVFGARGFEDATIKEIEERAELLHTMESLAAGDGDARTLLHALADLQIAFFRAHPDFGRLWLRWAGPGRWGLSPASLDHVGGDLARAMAVESGLIRRGQASGHVRPGDPDVLAHIFSGIVQAYQATDPASVGEAGAERLALTDLHALVEGAFAP